MVYNALLLNDRLPQEYFDHPGYLPILLLSYWLRALHDVGIIGVASFSAVPPVTDAAGFAAAWTQATQAGRVLSLLFALSFVVAFSYLLRALVRDWRIAQMGGFLLAFSGGMAMQMRTMRTELLAAGLFTIALLLLLIAAKNGERPWRPAVIGCASLLMTLAMLSKIQILFAVCAVPLVVLPFGPDAVPARGFWDIRRRGWPALAAAAATTAVAAYLARDILIDGLSLNGALWAGFAAWIGLGMIAYWLIWRPAPLEALAAVCAVPAGCSIGLLALYARYHPGNATIVFDPLTEMLSWAVASHPQLAAAGSVLNANRLAFAMKAVVHVIAQRSFILSPSSRPEIFLEWFVIAATVIAIRRREWRLVLQVAVLMLTDWRSTRSAERGTSSKAISS